jgi:hypothetical protein
MWIIINQKRAIGEVIDSADRVQGVQEYAGAGKTTTLAILWAASAIS